MTDRELMQMALDALEYPGPSWPDARQKAAEALRARLANEFNPDWNQVEALQESLREHMAEIQRLRAALATEQEPEPDEIERIMLEVWQDVGDPQFPYIAPPQREWMEKERAVGYREGHQAALKQREWQGLTDKDIDDIARDDCFLFIDLCRNIEAKLKEKNSD